MLVFLLQFRNLEVGCCHSINLKYVSEVVRGKKTDGSSWNDGYYAVKWRDTLKNGRLQKLEGRPCAYGNREHGKVAGSNLSASVCWLPLAVFGNVL